MKRKLDFKNYQKLSRKTAIYPNKGKNFIYPTLGLVGEAGEVAEKVKKIIRDKNSKLDRETKEAIKKELGDVLWYLAQIATELNFSLEEIARINLEKLFSRKKRGKIKGSGDNR
jgi:NTP pyrophosphatase (non-canonical NTP hydrolase)